MKKLILCLFLSAAFVFVKGQDESIPEPEFLNHIFILNKDKKLDNLEKKEAEMVTKSKVIGMGGAKQLYIIEGSKSTVVIPSGEMMFVMGTSGSLGMDPTSLINLYKFESKKNKRESVAGVYGGMGKSKDNENMISLNFKKLKDGVIGIVPDKPLEKGEYAFVNRSTMQGAGMTMKMEVFAFSVE